MSRGDAERSFRELCESVSNWGRWGTDDERGTLNLITSDVVRRAAAEVREGLTIGCGDLDLSGQGQGRSRGELRMISSGVGHDGGCSLATDSIDVAYHGPGHTHLDALCHVFYEGHMYNGRPASMVTEAGAQENSVAVFGDGIVTRAVLLDIPSVRGTEWVEPAEPVTVADLEAALDRQGMRFELGDALVVYVGRHERRRRLGRAAEFDGTPVLAGLTVECLGWLARHGVSLLMSDGGNDAIPSPLKGVSFPIHIGTLVYLGLPLIDNALLDELRASCRERDRHAFLLSVAPLRVEGGTGSPVNPIATM